MFWVVFSSPVRIHRFKVGARQGLGITFKERKGGVAVDGLGVTVEEPDRLVAALKMRGVRSWPTMGQAMGDVVGVATGAQAELRLGQVRRRRVKAARRLASVMALWTGGLAVYLLAGYDDGPVSWVGVATVIMISLGWAAVVGWVFASIGAGPGERRAVKDRVTVARALGPLTVGAVLAIVSLGVASWLVAGLDAPPAVAYALVAGTGGGVLYGLSVRAIRRRQ